jgi:hypothetical protein
LRIKKRNEFRQIPCCLVFKTDFCRIFCRIRLLPFFIIEVIINVHELFKINFFFESQSSTFLNAFLFESEIQDLSLLLLNSLIACLLPLHKVVLFSFSGTGIGTKAFRYVQDAVVLVILVCVPILGWMAPAVLLRALGESSVLSRGWPRSRPISGLLLAASHHSHC